METKAHLLNETMRLLVVAAVPLPLGVKAWQIKEYVSRPYDAVSPAEFMGLEPGQSGYCLLDEYVSRTGYQFDWGVLTENAEDDEDEEGGEEPSLIFEIVPELVLMQYPRTGPLNEMFNTLFESHPLFTDAFEYDEADAVDAVLHFRAFGKKEIADLRSWIAGVFLPNILPDILATMQGLLEIRKTDEEEFENQIGKWLAGEYDHRHMTLNSTQSQSSGIH